MPCSAHCVTVILSATFGACIARDVGDIQNYNTVQGTLLQARIEQTGTTRSLVTSDDADTIRQKLSHSARACLWNAALTSAVPVPNVNGNGLTRPPEYFLQAGDLPQMWLRDAPASLHHLLVADELWDGNVSTRHLNVKTVLGGLARRLAHFILKDPFCSAWEPYDNGRECRGGGSYNDMRFELDGPAYYLRLIRYLVHRQGALGILTNSKGEETVLSRAVRKLVDTFSKISSHHGLLKSESRPSDDMIAPGYYNVPQNVFVGAELHMLPLWLKHAPKVARIATETASGIFEAIRRFGTTKTRLGQIFCFEVNPEDAALGPRGNGCVTMDDANAPSLLSLPYFLADVEKAQATQLLNYTIYKNTRNWILSRENPYFFVARQRLLGSVSVEGIGSPHTSGLGPKRIWPMSVIMRGLTSDSKAEVRDALSLLIEVSKNDTGLMHETFAADHIEQYSRPWFDWVNALFFELLYKEKLVEKRILLNPPIDPFAGWVTCGWRAGQCNLTASMRDSNRVCVRFGSTFSGFITRSFSTKKFPLACTGKTFFKHQPFDNVPRPLPMEPYHCAIAEQASECKPDSTLSIIQPLRL